MSSPSSLIVWFVIISLASLRLTHFLISDTIPFGRLRDRLLDRWDNTIYAEGLTCPWCMGAWVSFALVGALAQIRSIPLPALYALAVSCVVGAIGQYLED